jgi:hypothetical protein
MKDITMKHLLLSGLMGLTLMGQVQAAANNNQLIQYAQTTQSHTATNSHDPVLTPQNLTPLTPYTQAHETGENTHYIFNRTVVDLFIINRPITIDMEPLIEQIRTPYRNGLAQGGLCTLGAVGLVYGCQGIASFASRKNYFFAGGILTSVISMFLGLFNSEIQKNPENRLYWTGWGMSAGALAFLSPLADLGFAIKMSEVLRKLNNKRRG